MVGSRFVSLLSDAAAIDGLKRNPRLRSAVAATVAAETDSVRGFLWCLTYVSRELCRSTFSFAYAGSLELKFAEFSG